jgi:hypothetical protein
MQTQRETGQAIRLLPRTSPNEDVALESRQIVLLKDTPHNLGLYYERAGEKMAAFVGKHLKK